MDDVISLIRMQQNNFTDTQNKIASYILDNPEKVISTSISELASACNSGVSSISRFCRSIGFIGYQDFRVAMAQSLVDKEKNENNKDADSTSFFQDNAKHIFEGNMNALKETYALIKEDDYKLAASYMLEAEKICFFGIGASYNVAQEGYFKLMRLTNKIALNMDVHAQYAFAVHMSEKDVAIIVSGSGSTKTIVEIAKLVKKTGCKIILISQFIKSPITKYVDVTLLWADNRRLEHEGKNFSIEIGPYYVMDMLLTQYFLDSDGEGENSLKKVDRVLTMHLY
ncbi:MAG: MurR/RpiR family transcriptional regulator [Lachnospiraceae bacterium]|nr:MurR/RpiR family transcriptional regulator [Lachnospiraceae bacterium]